MIAAFLLNHRGDCPAFVEILAGDHQLCTERLHRCVFLYRIDFWYDNYARDIVARGGKGDGLTVVAPRCRDQTVRQMCALAKGVHVNQPSAGFE